MMFKVLTAAGLLFGTGLLTGLGVGRITQDADHAAIRDLAEPTIESTGGTGIPPLDKAPPDKPPRTNRTNGVNRTVVRPPGIGRLEHLRRAMADLDLEPAQRERIEAHFRDSQEQLRALLKPLHPEAVRELRALRQKVLTELSKEQRLQFERQNKEASERSRLRSVERRD